MLVLFIKRHRNGCPQGLSSKSPGSGQLIQFRGQSAVHQVRNPRFPAQRPVRHSCRSDGGSSQWGRVPRPPPVLSPFRTLNPVSSWFRTLCILPVSSADRILRKVRYPFSGQDEQDEQDYPRVAQRAMQGRPDGRQTSAEPPGFCSGPSCSILLILSELSRCSRSWDPCVAGSYAA